jgi:hypothetical protein
VFYFMLMLCAQILKLNLLLINNLLCKFLHLFITGVYLGI